LDCITGYEAGGNLVNPSAVRYVGVAALFVLGLGFKPIVITFPSSSRCWIFGAWGESKVEALLQRTFQCIRLDCHGWCSKKLPLLVFSFASGVITFIAQRNGGTVTASDATWTWAGGFRIAFHSYQMYLRKSFFPVGLAPVYPGAILH